MGLSKIKKLFGINHFIKTAFFSVVILLFLNIAYSLLFFNKALPNTYFGQLKITGKNQNQIEKVVVSSIESFENSKQNLIVGGKIIEIDLREFGVSFSKQESVSRAANSFGSNKLKSLFLINRLKPAYKIDYLKFNNAISNNIKDFEKKSVNASVIFEIDKPVIAPGKNGIVVDRTKLVNDIYDNLDNLSLNKIEARYVEDKPIINAKQAEKALDRIKILNNRSISLVHNFDTWTVSGETLLDLLTVNTQSAIFSNYSNLNLGSSEIKLISVDYMDRQEPILEVKLDKTKIDEFVTNVANVINKRTVDATLEFNDLKVSQFTPAQDGKSLNQTLTKELLLNEISVDNLNTTANVNITLPVETTKAKIANERINLLGIKELIASGVSFFRGSIPNRAFNISLGSQLINGTLVPPGEVFSFNKLVGPVSSEQGFKQAYVISRGRTVLDDGGGICQVSTTVFRAALNAGLPIVERTAHAYRVSYYEQSGFEPGYDATIWSPTVDLKFRNDTDHYILVQAIVDKTQSKLQIDIYGTTDNRRVELTNPVITNRKPAPEPEYEDDPTLPVGTVKQVDWAAEGAITVFNRKVFKGGKTIIDESFKSNFRPWQAVYLVGTGG